MINLYRLYIDYKSYKYYKKVILLLNNMTKFLFQLLIISLLLPAILLL